MIERKASRDASLTSSNFFHKIFVPLKISKLTQKVLPKTDLTVTLRQVTIQKLMPVIGTRPEAIKLAPVIKELEEYPKEFEVITVTTAQHRQMLDQVLKLFKITPSYDLDMMEDNQTLPGITARIIKKFDPYSRRRKT